MSIIDRIEYLCRLGSFTEKTDPTLEQVEGQIAYEYGKLDIELSKKGYDVNDYPYEVIEIICYKVASEILLGNSRNNDNLSALGKEYLELCKESKKELLKNLAMIGNTFTEDGITESDYPDWIDEEVSW